MTRDPGAALIGVNSRILISRWTSILPLRPSCVLSGAAVEASHSLQSCYAGALALSRHQLSQESQGPPSRSAARQLALLGSAAGCGARLG
jgi:hypothetical protein